MTETTSPDRDPRATMFYLLILIAAMVAIIVVVARGALEEGSVLNQDTCMGKLVEPHPEDPDYNDKVLLYGSDVRECMRG